MNYTEIFDAIRRRADSGTEADIDWIMETLNNADLPITRAVDFYLGTVTTDNGSSRIRDYLFNGTLIQRNYSALFFERRNEWKLINEAYDRGCIDKIQAYSR